MVDSAFEAPTCHVLLIGIEKYAVKPLRGCVNDIDAIRTLLVTQAKVPPAQIRRLVAPLAGTAAPDELPTYANIRAALTSLAGDHVAADHRVFVAISCHGTRVPVITSSGRRFHREALVPVDVDEDPDSRRLLFDYEINTMLRAILARTNNVTVFLDCCNSAGVTRGDDDSMTSRMLDPEKDLALRAPLAVPDAAVDGAPIGIGLDACHVVAACLEHELAQEGQGPGGVHGLLTRSFLDSLGERSDAALWRTPWSQIWAAMRERIDDRNPAQHPWMSGSPGRDVLAGPPISRDSGIEIKRVPDTAQYAIGAGSLSRVTEGAQLAVYADRPAYFPALGSVEDTASRMGLVKVHHATPSRAQAIPVGEPFEPPPGARARLVAPGNPARLRCTIAGADAAVLEDLRSPFLELVEPARAQAYFERRGDGWALVDDVHGVRDMPPLVTLRDDELIHARAILEHYACYEVPLRMARDSTDLPDALELSILACPEAGLPADAAQQPDLPLAPTLAAATYDLVERAPVAIRIRNRSRSRLRVALLNAASSGKVQLIDDVIINADSNHMFWAGQALGRPFRMSVPAGAERGCDRMVAIGRTRVESNLDHLRSDTMFADFVPRLQKLTRGFEDEKDLSSPSAPPAELWTATQALVVTRRA